MKRLLRAIGERLFPAPGRLDVVMSISAVCSALSSGLHDDPRVTEAEAAAFDARLEALRRDVIAATSGRG